MYSIRRIALATKSEVVFYELNSVSKQMTVVQEGLYRTDAKYLIHNRAAPEEFCLYDLGGIVPYGVPVPPNPDETMCLIDVGGRKRVASKLRVWPKWLNMRNIVLAFVAILVAYHYLK